MPTAKDAYHVGTDGSKVYISVKVSTPGLVSTVVQFSGGTPTNLPDCDDDESGNINNCLVGVNGDIQGKTLQIKTGVDLQPVSPAQWPTMYDNLALGYTLSGGADGVKRFTYVSGDRTKDPTGQYITVIKKINLL